MHLRREEYFTQRQLAEHFDVGRDTLYRWRNEGYGPPFTRVGTLQRLVYRVADVEKWLKQKVVNAPVW